MTIETSSNHPNVIEAANEVVTAELLEEWLTPLRNKAAPISIQRLNDIPLGAAPSFLLYGRSGSGKTWTAGTLGSNALYLNIGDGIETLKSPLFRKRNPDIDPIVINITEKMNALTGKTDTASAFKTACESIDWIIANKLEHIRDGVILDDATFLRKFAMNAAFQSNAESRKDATKALQKQLGLQEYVKPEPDDYFLEMSAIEWFLFYYGKRFKALGLPFVMCAHARETFGKPKNIGDEAPVMSIRPGFTGKTFPDIVPAFFDNVFHFTAVTTAAGQFVTRADTFGSDIITAKTRHAGVLPHIIQQPNMKTIIAAIRRGELHPSFQGR